MRPALVAPQAQFGRDYILAARELATDGVDLLWEFIRSSNAPADTLMVGRGLRLPPKAAVPAKPLERRPRMNSPAPPR